jgi:hypothetical protein
VDESQLPLQQSPLPPQGMPVLRQQRLPAVVTTLFVQTAPVGSWQQSSSVVQAQVAFDVQRLPSDALQPVFPDGAHAPPEQRPPQHS